MVFKVPESKASFKQNKFELVLPDGRKFTLPKMQYLNSDLRVRMQSLGSSLNRKDLDPQTVAEFGLLQRELFDLYAPGLFGTISDDQLVAIQEAWQGASEIGLGESGASASS